MGQILLGIDYPPILFCFKIYFGNTGLQCREVAGGRGGMSDGDVQKKKQAANLSGFLVRRGI